MRRITIFKVLKSDTGIVQKCGSTFGFMHFVKYLRKFLIVCFRTLGVVNIFVHIVYNENFITKAIMLRIIRKKEWNFLYQI